MGNHDEALKETFCDTVEQLAFMFGEAADAADFPEPPIEASQVSMSFMGPINGRVVIAVDRDMCPELAANMLGLDADDPKAVLRGQDALKELLNVTCGNVLTKIAGDKPVFDLSVPEIHEMDAERWEALRETPGTLLLLVDGYPVMLNMSIMH